MTAVGLFAGRGDVVVAMGLAFVLGWIAAWWVRGKVERFKNRKYTK